LETLLEFIREGDALVVTRIDRLARSIGDLQDIVRALYAISPTVREIYAFSWASLRELDEARFRDSFGLAASMSGGGRRTTGR
jgi:resolvase-like protein